MKKCGGHILLSSRRDACPWWPRVGLPRAFGAFGSRSGRERRTTETQRHRGIFLVAPSNAPLLPAQQANYWRLMPTTYACS